MRPRPIGWVTSTSSRQARSLFTAAEDLPKAAGRRNRPVRRKEVLEVLEGDVGTCRHAVLPLRGPVDEMGLLTIALPAFGNDPGPLQSIEDPVVDQDPGLAVQADDADPVRRVAQVDQLVVDPEIVTGVIEIVQPPDDAPGAGRDIVEDEAVPPLPAPDMLAMRGAGAFRVQVDRVVAIAAIDVGLGPAQAAAMDHVVAVAPKGPATALSDDEEVVSGHPHQALRLAVRAAERVASGRSDPVFHRGHDPAPTLCRLTQHMAFFETRASLAGGLST